MDANRELARRIAKYHESTTDEYEKPHELTGESLINDVHSWLLRTRRNTRSGNIPALASDYEAGAD